MLQEQVSNSLKLMGSSNVFSVLFLNISFYPSCIFPWESGNLLFWKLKCLLVRLTVYIIHVSCFIYTVNPLPCWSFLVQFKANLPTDGTQPLSPDRSDLTWLLLSPFPHTLEKAQRVLLCLLHLLLTPWIPAESTKYFPCSKDYKVALSSWAEGKGGMERMWLSIARTMKCPAQDMLGGMWRL